MICRRLPADIREKVCGRLRRGKPYKRVWFVRLPAGRMRKFAVTSGGESLSQSQVSTARRRGVPFTRVKGTKTRLGLCPKTPVAGCAGYGLIYGGSRKSIRTAHRIAPKVATGVSALSPHPLSRWRERGSDGRAIRNRQQRSRGVRACKNRKPPTLKYLFPRPIVPLLGGGDRGGGSPFCAPAQRR